MSKYKYLIFGFIALWVFSSCSSDSYTENLNVEIIRDQWGVPHIYGKTDEDVAFGLAWAECEDDFITIQEQMAAIKGVLGEVKGKDGIVLDFAIKFMELRKNAEAQYQKVFSPKMKSILAAFVAGVNSYANNHKDQILDYDIFPVTEIEAAAGFMLGLVEITGALRDLEDIMDNKIHQSVQSNFPKGSNAIAISKKRTEENNTFIAINSHQPLEGWYSWYEAHLVSEEGLNILGGTFPGGAVIFHGANQNLAWAHTVNHADFSDVYKLTMNPENKMQYRYNDEWLTLEKQTHWAWLKVAGPLAIPIRRKNYKSIWGPTFETDDGYYAWRFVAAESVQAVEQWYQMNRASNFQEFYKALEMQAVPSTNIVYADKYDSIFYISNAKLPIRNPEYNWKEVIPGNSDKAQWNGFHKLSELPQVLNPDCGFVYNTNNTPFLSSCIEENPKETAANKTMGFQNSTQNNNRSLRLYDLLSNEERFTYKEFKQIKYDHQYPDSLSIPNIQNLERAFHLNPVEHPEIKDILELLNKWDRRTDIQNTKAFAFLIFYKHLVIVLKENPDLKNNNRVSDQAFVMALVAAKNELMEDHGKLEIPLGDVQRHIRGAVNLPLPGGPDVLAAIYCAKQDNNEYKAVAGESYIQMVQFDKEEVIIESVHAYGSSARPESPHYTDQMDLFVNQKLKKMSLKKEAVEVKQRYHPLQIEE